MVGQASVRATYLAILPAEASKSFRDPKHQAQPAGFQHCMHQGSENDCNNYQGIQADSYSPGMHLEHHPGKKPQVGEEYRYQTFCAAVVVEMEYAGVGKHSYVAVNE